MKPLFAGSFDPFTVGHLSIARRALALFGSLTVGVGVNESKKGEWVPDERVRIIADLFRNDHRVEVIAYTGLTVDFARRNGNAVLVRGARTTADFEFERTVAEANMNLAGIDTVIFPAEPQYSWISSSLVRELIHNNHPVAHLVAGNWSQKTASAGSTHGPATQTDKEE